LLDGLLRASPFQTRDAVYFSRGGQSVGQRGARQEDAGKILADQIIGFMQDLHVPNGLRELGYQSSDIPALIEGTLPQHRVTKLSPRPFGPDDLAQIFTEAMVAW